MRKIYEKPEIEVSLYLVNEAFASCTKIVDLGPSTASETTSCSSYLSKEDLGDDRGENEANLTVASAFYSSDDGIGTCGCTYTSGDGTILKS